MRDGAELRREFRRNPLSKIILATFGALAGLHPELRHAGTHGGNKRGRRP